MAAQQSDAKDENDQLKKENEELRRRVEELEQKLQIEEASPKLKPLPKMDDSTVLNVAVFGGGSFGTALATIAARRGHRVIMLVRDEEQCKGVNSEHVNRRRGWMEKYKLSDRISATTSMKEAVSGCQLIIHTIPSQHTPAFLSKYREEIPMEIPIVSCSKGIHLASGQLMSEVIPRVLHRHADNERLCYLSGPSFAKEMMEEHPVAVVVAAHDAQWARFVQSALNTERFRIYISSDVIGVECGGALKNPLAIGAGMADGLKYGQSTLAAIVTRGAVEIQRMAMVLGAKHPETLYGLAGFGDLMLTSMCSLSRNRTCGYLMASENLTVEEAMAKIGETVEGVATAKVAQQIIKKHGLRCPLFEALANVLAGKLKPEQVLKEIVAKRPEDEGFVTNYTH